MKIVHKVCCYFRQGRNARGARVSRDCKECPASEKVGAYTVVRGCRVEAEELINIVKWGNPWGKKYRNSRKYWPNRKAKA